MSDKRARCGACGELWPCSVKRNQSAYRADIVVTHHAMPNTGMPKEVPSVDPRVYTCISYDTLECARDNGQRLARITGKRVRITYRKGPDRFGRDDWFDISLEDDVCFGETVEWCEAESAGG